MSVILGILIVLYMFFAFVIIVCVYNDGHKLGNPSDNFEVVLEKLFRPSIKLGNWLREKQ